MVTDPPLSCNLVLGLCSHGLGALTGGFQDGPEVPGHVELDIPHVHGAERDHGETHLPSEHPKALGVGDEGPTCSGPLQRPGSASSTEGLDLAWRAHPGAVIPGEVSQCPLGREVPGGIRSPWWEG